MATTEKGGKAGPGEKAFDPNRRLTDQTPVEDLPPPGTRLTHLQEPDGTARVVQDPPTLALPGAPPGDTRLRVTVEGEPDNHVRTPPPGLYSVRGPSDQGSPPTPYQGDVFEDIDSYGDRGNKMAFRDPNDRDHPRLNPGDFFRDVDNEQEYEVVANQPDPRRLHVLNEDGDLETDVVERDPETGSTRRILGYGEFTPTRLSGRRDAQGNYQPHPQPHQGPDPFAQIDSYGDQSGKAFPDPNDKDNEWRRPGGEFVFNGERYRVVSVNENGGLVDYTPVGEDSESRGDWSGPRPAPQPAYTGPDPFAQIDSYGDQGGKSEKTLKSPRVKPSRLLARRKAFFIHKPDPGRDPEDPNATYRVFNAEHEAPHDPENGETRRPMPGGYDSTIPENTGLTRAQAESRAEQYNRGLNHDDLERERGPGEKAFGDPNDPNYIRPREGTRFIHPDSGTDSEWEFEEPNYPEEDLIFAHEVGGDASDTATMYRDPETGQVLVPPQNYRGGPDSRGRYRAHRPPPEHGGPPAAKSLSRKCPVCGAKALGDSRGSVWCSKPPCEWGVLAFPPKLANKKAIPHPTDPNRQPTPEVGDPVRAYYSRGRSEDDYGEVIDEHVADDGETYLSVYQDGGRGWFSTPRRYLRVESPYEGPDPFTQIDSYGDQGGKAIFGYGGEPNRVQPEVGDFVNTPRGRGDVRHAEEPGLPGHVIRPGGPEGDPDLDYYTVPARDVQLDRGPYQGPDPFEQIDSYGDRGNKSGKRLRKKSLLAKYLDRNRREKAFYVHKQDQEYGGYRVFNAEYEEPSDYQGGVEGVASVPGGWDSPHSYHTDESAAKQAAHEMNHHVNVRMGLNRERGPGEKALSAFGEGSGGALVAPPRQLGGGRGRIFARSKLAKAQMGVPGDPNRIQHEPGDRVTVLGGNNGEGHVGQQAHVAATYPSRVDPSRGRVGVVFNPDDDPESFYPYHERDVQLDRGPYQGPDPFEQIDSYGDRGGKAIPYPGDHDRRPQKKAVGDRYGRRDQPERGAIYEVVGEDAEYTTTEHISSRPESHVFRFSRDPKTGEPRMDMTRMRKLEAGGKAIPHPTDPNRQPTPEVGDPVRSHYPSGRSEDNYGTVTNEFESDDDERMYVVDRPGDRGWYTEPHRFLRVESPYTGPDPFEQIDSYGDRGGKALNSSNSPRKDRAGGLVPPDTQKARRVDLITLPRGVKGTNCSNCLFVKKTRGGAFCSNDRVRMPVNDRMCCALWKAPGQVESWKTGPGGGKGVKMAGAVGDRFIYHGEEGDPEPPMRVTPHRSNYHDPSKVVQVTDDATGQSRGVLRRNDQTGQIVTEFGEIEDLPPGGTGQHSFSGGPRVRPSPFLKRSVKMARRFKKPSPPKRDTSYQAFPYLEPEGDFGVVDFSLAGGGRVARGRQSVSPVGDEEAAEKLASSYNRQGTHRNDPNANFRVP